MYHLYESSLFLRYIPPKFLGKDKFKDDQLIWRLAWKHWWFATIHHP